MKIPRLFGKAADIAVPAGRAVVAVFRQNSSTPTQGPSTRFRSTGGEYARYYPNRDIQRARMLWSSDGYASEVINNIVDFAAGSGAKVLFENPRWQMAWDNWAWNRPNPKDRPPQLFRTAILRLVRDGNILDVKQIGPEGPYLKMLNPAYLYGATGTDIGYSGVETDDTGKPVVYNYRPTHTYGRRERSVRYRSDQLIHIFKTEWDEGQLIGETWLRKALKSLDELDALDASMTFSVIRAAKTPALYKIPLDMAYTYVRTLDAQGNPIDPDETQDERTMAARTILERTMGAPGEDGVIPDEVDLVSRPFSATVSDPARLVLLERVCRGVGISMAAALGKFGTGGYLSNRFAVAQDEKFYAIVQEYGETHTREVIDWWQGVMANTSFELAGASRDYKIELPVFPMANLQQDAMAMKILREQEAVSPQTVSRRYGHDPYDQLREIIEWQKVKQEMMIEAGLMTAGPAESEEPEEEEPSDGNGSGSSGNAQKGR